MNYSILSIDPGTREAGCCHWDLIEWKSKQLAIPTRAIVAKTRKTNLVNRCEDLMEQFDIDWAWIDHVFIEEPRVFGGSLGFAAKESAMELMFFCGWVASVAVSMGAGFTFVPIQKWKGNMSKDMTCKRITNLAQRHDKKLPLTRKRSHDWDACGIGFFAQGFKL